MISQTAFQTNRWVALAVAFVSIGIVSPAWAVIPITNPGFEANPVGDLASSPQRYNNTALPSEYFNPLATGWTLLHPTISDPTFTDAV